MFSTTDKYRQTEHNLVQKTSCSQLSLFLLSAVSAAYLAMRSVWDQRAWMLGWLRYHKFKMFWKEPVVACLRYWPSFSWKRWENKQKDPFQDSWDARKNSRWVPPKYKSRAQRLAAGTLSALYIKQSMSNNSAVGCRCLTISSRFTSIFIALYYCVTLVNKDNSC